VAYTLLAGRVPYPRQQAIAVMYAQVYDPPPPVTEIRRDLPSAVNGVVARAMGKQPGDRYESCMAFAGALREALELPPWTMEGTRAGQPAAPGQARSGDSRPPGHDSRPGTWIAVVAGDRAYYDSVWAADVPPQEVIGFPEGLPERRFPLSGAALLIGRRRVHHGIYPEIDLTGPPADTGVAPAHARLVAEPDGGWSVIDLDSPNGTLVNGREIPPGTRVRLRDGDRLNLGMWTVITITRQARPSP
jgi:hypothetical protein